MGSFHCIPSSCAEVVYQDYLPKSVVYQYPGEEPVEIVGATSYELQSEGQCSTQYTITASCRAQRWDLVFLENRPAETEGSFARYYYPSDTPSFAEFIIGPISSVEFEIFGSCPNNRFLTTCAWGKQEIRLKVVDSEGTKYSNAMRISRDFPFQTAFVSLGSSSYLHFNTDFLTAIDQIDIQLNRSDGLPDNCCTLKVFKDEEIVYQETRDICPQAEVLPCRLNPIRKVIRINKIPYLERVEVIDWAYQNYLGLLNPNDYGLLVVRQDIPPECLNVYKNPTTTSIPLPGVGVGISNTGQEAYDHIEQVCSPIGCPPPEYQVICDCDCRECPPETCPVECTGQICCYDKSTGIAVESIPIAEYCKNQL